MVSVPWWTILLGGVFVGIVIGAVGMLVFAGRMSKNG